MKPINYLGAQYHGSFSRTNYFDAHGVFMGVMWAAPLLLDMMLLMGLLLRQSAQMLVKVKTQQFQKQRAQKMKSAAGQSKNADGPKQEVKERKRPSKLEPPADTPEPQISLLPHILHWSITTYRRVFSSSQTAGPPSRLDINSTAARKPAHVAVSFRGSNVPDAQTVIRVATWCMDHNVRVLTVHDASGVLKTMAESIADSSSITTQVLVAGIPLKPSSQPSAHPMLYVNIVSDNEGRAALVDVARTFAADPSAPQVTVESVDTALRAGKVPLPTPEPNLVFLTHTHSDSIQIGNFLPWDIRLSEFT
ncbi:transmembrane protein 18-domain-containing protein [Powellomyces hirtus]|nr:transmembrane protein 18-domain-containing protein [Powellomyces hirtus]